MLLEMSSSIEEIKQHLNTLRRKAEYWMKLEHNEEANRQYLEDFVYPLQKQLDQVENLWQLSVIINLPKFK